MNRWILSDASFEALLRLADDYGAEVPENVTRDELEEIVNDAAEEWHLEHWQANNHSVRIEETKYDTQVTELIERRAEEEVELPESYNETRVVLMLRDPSWAFAYWDLRESDRRDFERSESFEGLLLRVYDIDEPEAPLAAARGQYDIPVTLLDNRWYINLPDQETVYRLALVACDGAERELAVSNAIVVPRGTLADGKAGAGPEAEDQILAQTGIQDLDLPATARRIPQRILDLIDEDLLFN